MIKSGVLALLCYVVSLIAVFSGLSIVLESNIETVALGVSLFLMGAAFGLVGFIIERKGTSNGDFS